MSTKLRKKLWRSMDGRSRHPHRGEEAAMLEDR